ncbi:MAG: response regulator, partial [Cyanobacteria bacterium J06635_15]
MRILLVDDDESVAKVLKKVLTDGHYAVDVAHDGQAGWQLVNSFDYDLIVLDVVLPKLDGFEFCRRLREKSYSMPVLLVTALDSSTKKITGLNAGADDYITKPFECEELLARVRVLLRRVQAPVLSTLESGELRLDLNSREVTYGKFCLNLTPKEYGLLELFLRNPSQVFSRGAILDNLWSCSEAPGEDTVTAHIKGLRRKLTDAGAPNDLIKTVYGVGYRLKPAALTGSETDSEQATPVSAVAPESKLATTSQKTKAALAALWHSTQFQQIERLTVLKQTVRALQRQQLTDDLRQAAIRATHSLAGSLGVFGLSSGSDLARAIEQILQGDAPIHPDDQKQLFKLVKALATEIEQALHQPEAVPPGLVSPPLVIVDDNLLLQQQLTQAVQTQGLTVRVVDQVGVLQALRSQLDVIKRRAIPPNHPDKPKSDRPEVETSLPDVVVFDVSLASLDDAELKQLSQLINQVPPMLLIVGSADGSLANRIRTAQLGSHSFLHNPDVATLLNSVLKVRSRLQHPANKVLAVDDDPQILNALRARLEPQGLELVTLDHPLEFWPTLQASAPD